MSYYTHISPSEVELSRSLTLEEVNEFNDIYDGVRFDPKDYPDYYCLWEPSRDGTELVMEYSGTRYSSTICGWLNVLIDDFLAPKGIKVLDCRMEYQGEETGDTGWLIVKDNKCSELSSSAYINSLLREIENLQNQLGAK